MSPDEFLRLCNRACHEAHGTTGGPQPLKFKVGPFEAKHYLFDDADRGCIRIDGIWIEAQRSDFGRIRGEPNRAYWLGAGLTQTQMVKLQLYI